MWTIRQALIAAAMADQLNPKQMQDFYIHLKTLQSQQRDPWTDQVLWDHLPLGLRTWFETKDFSLMDRYYWQAGVRFLTIEDAAYPQRLRETYQAPIVLFYRGNLELLSQMSIAIVGSRNHTSYGTAVVEQLIPVLVHQGWVTLSGLARGIDGLSHQVCLDHGGKTIGVIGSGINVVYPRHHEKLYQEIGQKGLLLSEYPLDSKPLAFHFPYRNRIIAGLCHSLCVIEAKESSGSLITANLALSENRQVCAVPGPIHWPSSMGTNLLIKAGAQPILTGQDLVESAHYFD